MKKVLIVASVISFIEWFNKENIEYLHRDLGCEVHIACNFNYMEDTDEKRTKLYIRKLKSDGIILHNIGFERNPINKANIKAYIKLKRLIFNEKFDLIHTHTPATSIFVRLAARKSRKKGTMVMYTCHGFHFHNSSSKKNWLLYYPIERWMSRYTDFLVTINKEDYNRAKTFHAQKVRYIPGVGVDINKIQEINIDSEKYKESIGIPRNSIMILSVGEIIERKNHEVIIRALGLLNSYGLLEKNNLYYVICGKGPLKDTLQKLAKDLNIDQRVVFLGFRTDIPELCNTADISAFPSKIEGLGLAGIEAMAAGVPLVSSNVHGILDYVKNGKTGFAYNPNDIKGFAKGINKLARDKKLRDNMKINCLEAVKPFELNNALHEMWDIYNEILR